MGEMNGMNAGKVFSFITQWSTFSIITMMMMKTVVDINPIKVI